MTELQAAEQDLADAEIANGKQGQEEYAERDRLYSKGSQLH